MTTAMESADAGVPPRFLGGLPGFWVFSQLLIATCIGRDRGTLR